MGWTSQCSNPGRGKRIFSLILVSGSALGPVYLVLWLPGLKRPECEVDYSTTGSAKLKMVGVTPLLPLYTFKELTGTTIPYH
jgi:hypothetical protein